MSGLPPLSTRTPIVGPDGLPTRYGRAYLEGQEGVAGDETKARIAADADLQGAIDAEGVARASADTTLQGNIDAEESARQSADAALQGNIDAEESARQAADTALQGQIDGIPGTLTATATLDFPSILAQAQAELTITVAGAVVGDAVAVGAPATIEAGLAVMGYVSAADTVTVRALNVTAAPIDPASATFRATVFQG